MNMILNQHNVFPTVIFTAKIDDYENINKRLLHKIDNLPENEKISKLYGWQTDINIHKTWLEFNDLWHKLNSIVDHIQQHLCFTPDTWMTSAWCQMYQYKQRMEKHTHPNCFYSAAYYVKCQHGSGRINFHDTRPNNSVVTFPLTAPNEFSSGMFSITPDPGLAVFFPSWSPHSVEANDDDDTRVSLAFNWMKPLYEEGITSA
jgi:uncharacterized protein (TIGR02466 family)